MDKSRKALVNDEWIVVVLGFIVLALSVLFPNVMNSFKIPGILAAQSANALGSLQGWLGAVYIFVFVLALLYLAQALTGKPFKGIFLSFLVICLLTVVSLALATIPFCKKYGLEAVLFAVILGLIISNCFKVPDWLKPAIQSEFYIKIGIVCLGATVLYQEVLKSGAYGLAQALIVVLCVWYFGFWVSRKVFKVDDEMATMLASSVSICGVSAAIATCGTIKGDQKKLSYVISLVMVVAIPMLYIMPLLCNWLLP
ncbi:MAG: putative sulfate exporter family transporter, partial [Bacteroidaceae bacterium]|nr:putative sulfate exporter family transporter [Bacteroidaceae bacterium]